MALHTRPDLQRQGFTRRAEHPPCCPDCDRVLHRVDTVRRACRNCGLIVPDAELVRFAFGDPPARRTEQVPAELVAATFDIARRSHVPRPGPGQGQLF